MPKSTLYVKLNRTYGALEAALTENPDIKDCELFKEIVSWVLMDDGYLSCKSLTNRIRQLEERERRAGIMPPIFSNRVLENLPGSSRFTS